MFSSLPRHRFDGQWQASFTPDKLTYKTKVSVTEQILWKFPIPRKTWGAAHVQTVRTRCSLRFFERLGKRLSQLTESKFVIALHTCKYHGYKSTNHIVKQLKFVSQLQSVHGLVVQYSIFWSSHIHVCVILM